MVNKLKKNEISLKESLFSPRGNRRRISNTRNQRVKVHSQLTISQEHHASLLSALMEMMTPHLSQRDNYISRFNRISQELAAYRQASATSEELESRRKRNETLAIPEQEYPIASGQIEDIVTTILQILFPARAMYGSLEMSIADENPAQAFVTVQNAHAHMFSHYNSYRRMINDAVSFNLGIIESTWAIDFGNVSAVEGENITEPSRQPIREGNKIVYLDPWNTILDYRISPEEYATEAEFYATVELVSNYQIRKMISEGKAFADDAFVNNLRSIQYEGGRIVPAEKDSWYPNLHHAMGSNYAMAGLYRERPPIRTRGWLSDCPTDKGAAFDTSRYFGSENAEGSAKDLQQDELLNLTVRIVPKDYGLSKSTQLELWKFKIHNGHRVIFAAPVALAHGLMPCSITMPRDEDNPSKSKSIAEKLIPFQNLISNVYSLYLRGMRKSVNNGIVMFDTSKVALDEMADPTGAYVPVTLTEDDVRHGYKIHDAIKIINDRTEINNTVNDIAQIKQIMQDVVPTDLVRIMGDLNRPVAHQSQSITNAASRRIYALARVISNQTVTPQLQMMSHNITAYQRALKVIGADGKPTDINPEVFKDEDLTLTVSDGLRGIDTVAIAQQVSEVLRYSLQSRQIQGEIDVTKLLEFLLQLQGANFSVDQFRHQNEFDKLDPEQKNIAFQLLQQAAQQQGNPEEAPNQE